MSDVPQSVPQNFAPIADAFAAADAEAAKTTAEQERRAAEAQQRMEDEAYFVDLYRRQGAAQAKRVGRAFGLFENDMDRLIRLEDEKGQSKAEKVKAKKREKEQADTGGAGDKPPRDDAPVDDDDKPLEWKPKKNPIKPLPADCPVTPVGKNGLTFYFLDPRRQLITMTEKNFGAAGLRALFGDKQDFLWSTWPKYNEKTHEQSGWKADAASETLIDAASKKGWFDPDEMIRSMGGWRGDANSLVLHCGNEVLVDGVSHPPGFVQGYLYSAGVASQKPADAPMTEDEARQQQDAIDRVLSTFDSYNWLDGPGDTG
ncbi:MAG: hypothetical protein ACRDBL_09490, partial [Rhabdaerophilum sp.]